MLQHSRRGFVQLSFGIATTASVRYQLRQLEIALKPIGSIIQDTGPVMQHSLVRFGASKIRNRRAGSVIGGRRLVDETSCGVRAAIVSLTRTKQQEACQPLMFSSFLLRETVCLPCLLPEELKLKPGQCTQMSTTLRYNSIPSQTNRGSESCPLPDNSVLVRYCVTKNVTKPPPVTFGVRLPPYDEWEESHRRHLRPQPA